MCVCAVDRPSRGMRSKKKKLSYVSYTQSICVCVCFVGVHAILYVQCSISKLTRAHALAAGALCRNIRLSEIITRLHQRRSRASSGQFGASGSLRIRATAAVCHTRASAHAHTAHIPYDDHDESATARLECVETTTHNHARTHAKLRTHHASAFWVRSGSAKTQLEMFPVPRACARVRVRV